MTHLPSPDPDPRSRRFRLRAVAGGLGAMLVVGLALLLSGALRGGVERDATHLARVCRTPVLPSARSDKDGGGDPDKASAKGPCVFHGGPELFSDLQTSATELDSRQTAPFSTIAPGAYGHAVAQRADVPGPGAAPGSGFSWRLAGSPPECADPSTTGSVCPAAGPDNGNYSYMGPLGFRTLSGRISAFAYDATNTSRYFAAPVVGGIWESTDAGAHWRSIGDALPTQTMGAVAYDAPLHRIIAGSGDNSFGGTGISGHGIYYSDDDGASWHTAGGIPDLALSFKLLVSPADSSGNTVYAATSKGLFRSTDGGATFTNENLPTTPSGYTPNCAGDTTTKLCFFANIVTDVVVKPTTTSNGNAGAVMAVVGWRAGQKPDTDPSGNPLTCGSSQCEQSPQNGIYTSADGAPGSFTFQSASSNGFAPDNVVGRTALGIAHGSGQDSDAIYALVEDAQKFNHCPDILDTVNAAPTCNATVNGEAIATVLDGMYASYDFGKTWTKVMDWSQLKDPGTNSALTAEAGYSPGVQAWYNLWVEPDPTATDSTSGDPTRVLFGLEEVWENNPSPGAGDPLHNAYTSQPPGTPGGATTPWVVIGRYWNACGGVNVPAPVGPCNPSFQASGPIPGTTTHPDQHAYSLIPDGKGGVTLLIGSDGGAYSQHIDSGQDFSNDNWGDGLNATLPTIQPYDAEMAKDGTVVSGLQDNGEFKIAPSGHEAEIYGGDGFWNTIDPTNSKNIIEEYTYGQPSISTDGGNSWIGDTPTDCGSSTTSLFSTPIEQDPTQPGHVLVGCQQLAEATDAYNVSCVDPTCSLVNTPTFNNVFDLSTLPSPNGAPNIPSALALKGANAYAAYCGYCDPATQQIPFANGIATNVGGSAPPQIGTSNGWHQAAANCAGCGTANGKLPERYINSIQMDPHDPNTVYVTLGGYGRRWIPPGSFGEDTSNVGTGHVFVSHDHGENFADITGNLPDISANWTVVHNGQLVVGTDLGVYEQVSGSTAARATSAPTYGVLGNGLPLAPVMTMRISPANPDLLLVSTYGRGDWVYSFTSNNPSLTPPASPAGAGPASNAPGTTSTPACTAATRITFHLHKVPHGRVVRVLVYVNGRRVVNRRGHSLHTVTITRGSAKTIKVKIVTINNKRGRVITTRSFTGCTRTKVKGATKKHKKHKKHTAKH
jgi:hypothetical protein